MRRMALVMAMIFMASPVTANEPAAGTSADELQSAIARIREKVDAQRAETGSAAKDAAEQAAELDRLVTHMAALEHENGELRASNDKLEQDLDEGLRKAARLEQENDALAKVASGRLDGLIAAARELVAARAEMDRIGQVLGDLEAGRAVLTAVAQDMPLLVTTPAAASQEAVLLRAELKEARARIAALEAERR